MIQVEVLEQQIAELDEDSFTKLRNWMNEFEQMQWDKKIEKNSNSGKLDFLINSALEEHQSGKTKDL